MRSIMRTVCSVAALASFVIPSVALAAPVLDNGTYRLGNHPDGNVRPPLYGMRLDGLDGNTGHEFTFDFENTPGANMYMTVNIDQGDPSNSTIDIFGTVFGGEDVGGSYGAVSGFWDVDFTYSANIDVLPSGQIVVTPGDPANTGTITPQADVTNGGGGVVFDGGVPIYLANHPINSVDNAFNLGTNHRGFAGVSGWGWLRYGSSPTNLNHVDSSDWLFTVGEMVPAPGAMLLGSIGIAMLGFVRRRNG